MKKMILSMLLLIIVIPFIVRADTCEMDNITIDKVTVVENNNTIEKDTSVSKGRVLGIVLAMSNVGDSIKYEMVINNNGDDEFKIDKLKSSGSNDYIEYVLETEDDSNLIEPHSSKKVYLNVEYKNEIPREEFLGNEYLEGDRFYLNLVKGAKSAIENPDTGDTIIIAIFILLICIGFILMIKKKKSGGFVALFGLIAIPVYVSAICNVEIGINSNIKIINYVCKRATTLHGTYGNIGTTRDLNVGDAFDCDVNGDGIYDSEQERFYYLSDYFDTHNMTYSDSYAVLIYYSNVIAGSPNAEPGFSSRSSMYSETGYNFYGPTYAINQLPTTEQWNNVSLINNKRAILTHLNTNSFDYSGTVNLEQNFDYSGRAARLPIYQEIHPNCPHLGVECSFLFEGVGLGEPFGNSGYWLDNPSILSTINNYDVAGVNQGGGFSGNYARKTGQYGVRPVIELEKGKLEMVDEEYYFYEYYK